MENICIFVILAHIGLCLSTQGPFLSWGVNYQLLESDKGSEVSKLISSNDKFLLFIQPELSVEDVTLHSQTLADFVGNNNVWIPAVSSPASTVESIVTSKQKTSKMINPLSVTSGSFSDADMFVVNLPSKGEQQSRQEYINKNVDYMKDIIEKFGDKKALAILTGDKNLQDCDNLGFSSQRQMLAAKLDAEDDNGYVYNVSGEILLFTKQITISKGKELNEVLSFKNSKATGSSANKTASLSITFESTKNISDLKFSMEFVNIESYGQWALSSFKASMAINGKEETEYDFKVQDITTPFGFSYSCNDVVVINGTDKEAIKISFKQLQVQPFGVKKSKFSAPYDCLGILSIPIWMGLIVTLIFTIILIVGSSVVMNIKTMDKFDDPKGKTITVPTVE